MLKAEEINNEVRDISWLKEQIKTNIFGIYAIVEKDKKRFAYSCIQSKTSIRDRVTRDREPSINAMNAFFLYLAIVLDGEYLKNPKFQYMVNGKSTEYRINGWHAMYVLTNKTIENDRIFTIDMSMGNLINHLVKGSEFWLKQIQWMNTNWHPEEKSIR